MRKCQHVEDRTPEKTALNILAILGSPRKGGNTSILLDRAVEAARAEGGEVETVNACRLRIRPCEEIYQCRKNAQCPLRDDMQALYPKLLSADGIIFASPIFFYGITAQAKALVDRCQALYMRKHVLKWPPVNAGPRHGVFLSVGGTRGENLFGGAVLTVRYFFDAIDVEYTGELLIRRIDEKGEILEHPDLLEQASELGRRLVRGLQAARGEQPTGRVDAHE